MKKQILCVGICLLIAGAAYATPLLENTVTRVVLQTVAPKPYYANLRTQRVCETWKNCATWAKELYQADATFQVKHAQEVTRFWVHRHTARYETRLEVNAVFKGKSIHKNFEPYVPARR